MGMFVVCFQILLTLSVNLFGERVCGSFDDSPMSIYYHGSFCCDRWLGQEISAVFLCFCNPTFNDEKKIQMCMLWSVFLRRVQVHRDHSRCPQEVIVELSTYWKWLEIRLRIRRMRLARWLSGSKGLPWGLITWLWFLDPTWRWKEKADSTELSSDLYIYAVAYLCLIIIILIIKICDDDTATVIII